MYAKSILEQVRARAVAGAWMRHLGYAPVALALGVAALPFTLQPHYVAYAPPASSVRGEPVASESSLFTGLVQANVSTSPKRMGLPIDKQQRLIVNYITRKFGVSTDVVQDLVKTAFAAGNQYGIDPRLVVAIMAVESSFNPIAESFAGAKGLMQIIPKYHLEKFEAFGGEQAVFDPRVNIQVGARIVREYLLMHSGDLFAALQTYAGALNDRDSIYTHRVLNEKDQLDTLAGLPKTDRRHRVTMSIEAEQPGKAYAPATPLATRGDAQGSFPATTGTSPAPAAATPVEEQPVHTPPTQPLAKLSLPSVVNVSLAQPDPALRF